MKGFYIQADYWEGIKDLPVRQQNEICGSIVRLFFTGEEGPELKGASRSAVSFARGRILGARNKALKWDEKSKEQSEDKPMDNPGNIPRFPIKEGEGEDLSKDKSKEKQEKEIRHKYGSYKNVLLSDSDIEKLKSEFPHDWEERIERLSEGIASKGYKYANHLATIRKWAKKDREKGAKDAKPSEYASLW